MTKITYFFATISPYTYFAGLRLEKIAAKHRASIEYRPMNLMSVFYVLAAYHQKIVISVELNYERKSLSDRLKN